MNSYLKLCTEFYEIDKPTAPRAELAFYERFAAAAEGPVLEAMCGTGRFLVPLVERGFDVDGVDASPQMLAACRERCRRLHRVPELEQQFLHELSMRRRYALAFISSGSFGLIEREQAGQSLVRLRDHLAPGATLVIEAHARRPRDAWSGPWGGRWVQRPDGAKIIISWLSSYDAAAGVSRSIHRYDLIQAGRLLETEFEEFDIQLYDRDEVTRMLLAAGFGDVRYLKLHESREPDEADDEIAYVCRRA